MFFIQCSPSAFRSQWWFLPEKIIIVVAAKKWFSNSISLFDFIHWNSIVRKSIFFSPLYLLIYWLISVWTQEFLFYSLGYTPLLSKVLTMLELSQIWLVEAPSSCLLCPSHKPPSFEHLSAFWHKKFSKFTLHFSCSRPRVSHFSKEPWILSVENDI